MFERSVRTRVDYTGSILVVTAFESRVSMDGSGEGDTYIMVDSVSKAILMSN
jgi:hypothetical protein